MYFENLKSRQHELLQFLKAENYSATVIRNVTNEINSILENAEISGWETYRDVYRTYEAGGFSKDVLRGKRHCLRMLKRFDVLGEFPDLHFEIFFGKRAENTTGIVQLTVLNRIDDMMRYELVQMLVRNIQCKYCQNCERLFIPSGRSDSLYCDRVMYGENKPCKEIGAQIIAKKKLQNNNELKIYRQAYQRLKKRVEFGYMSDDEFDKWNAEALPMKNKCTIEKLSVDEFKAWIDKTSRQEHN